MRAGQSRCVLSIICAGLVLTACNWTSTGPDVPIRHVATITIDSGIVLAVGEKVRLGVSVLDSAGLPMTVPPESLAFTVVAGAPVLALVADFRARSRSWRGSGDCGSGRRDQRPARIRVVLHRYVVTDLGVDVCWICDVLAINGVGQVAGTATVSAGGGSAFLSTPNTPNGTSGRIIELGAPEGIVTSKAADLNDAGQVVGTGLSRSRLFRLHMELGALRGSLRTIAKHHRSGYQRRSTSPASQRASGNLGAGRI